MFSTERMRTWTKDWFKEWWADALCCLVTCVHGRQDLNVPSFPFSFQTRGFLACSYAPLTQGQRSSGPGQRQHSDTDASSGWGQERVQLLAFIEIYTISSGLTEGNGERHNDRMTSCRDAQCRRWTSWNIHPAALTGKTVCAWLLWHAPTSSCLFGARPRGESHIYTGVCSFQAFQ